MEDEHMKEQWDVFQALHCFPWGIGGKMKKAQFIGI